jgi:two-component system cell cycle response regulator
MVVVQDRQSLRERIESAPYSSMPCPNVIVPFYDEVMFAELANEALASIGRHYGEDLLVILDANTAAGLHAIKELREHARRIIVFGDTPNTWLHAENVTSRPDHPDFSEGGHLLLLISSCVSIAILGSNVVDREPGGGGFEGGWTVHRGYVAHAAETLAGAEARDWVTAMKSQSDASGQMADIAMRLMVFHADVLASRQHDIAMDKSDLFSVLNILKAISTKRRAHDILFVFVEQIARVVSSNRCSVVRVWSSESHGQVLASHEDSTVMDRTIEIAKYPELRKAMATGQKVVVNDVHSDPLTAPFADAFRQAHISAILVIPIVLFDENIGSLFLRAARSDSSFTLREISFFEIVTNAAANALERAHLFESIQIANETLERLAITDGLTGLFNHRYFRDRLTQELQRAMRYRLPLACAIFDIDDFKKFNDTYGHLFGDSILREISERTLQCVRKSDVVARYGGEEFVVIMPQTTIEGAMAQGERIRALIDSQSFHGGAQTAHVTVSVGIGVLDHDRMLTTEDLLREADQSLYKAKRSGKNQVAGPPPAEEQK